MDGLEVITDSGVVQIDSNYLNYMYDGKQTVNIAANSITNVSFSDVADTHLMAMGLTDASCKVTCMRRHDAVSKVTTYKIYCGTNATSVVVYSFKFGDLGNTANFGLEIYNAQGVLGYSSSKPAMKVIGQFSDTYALGNPGEVTTNLYTLTQVPESLAIVVSCPSMSMNKFADPSGAGWLIKYYTRNVYWLNRAAKNINRTAITYSVVGQGQLSRGTLSNNANSILVIDVTGY